MDASQPSNAYLSGNFAPVRSEDDHELEIVGEIPPGLAGAFYRNGPNPQFEPRGHYHWFAGDGMVPTHNSTLGLDFLRSCSIKNRHSSIVFSLDAIRVLQFRKRASFIR